MTSLVVAQWPSAMHTPGVAGQSESAVQARQVFAVVLQIGLVATAQSALATHSTHAPDDAQAGVAELMEAHSVPLAQARQAFVVVLQSGFVATLQSPLATHSTQAPDVAQAGVEALSVAHSAPVEHARQLFVTPQIGLVCPGHSEFVVHCTHAPVDAHVGVVGVFARHSALAEHPRQVFIAVSQTGFEGVVQLVFVAHSTQPTVGTQTSADPPSTRLHSLPIAQARHAFVIESQTGVAPEHFAAVQDAGTSPSPSRPASDPSGPSGPLAVSTPPSDTRQRLRDRSQVPPGQSPSPWQ
jgi:hypothetical protein